MVSWHRRLLADVAGLRPDGEGFSASLVVRYLQEWLFRHGEGADRDLALFLTHSDQALRGSVPAPVPVP